MIGAIVLAAGEGRRLGRVKPLVSIDGKPALSRVIAALQVAGVEEPVVVLGHAAAEIQEKIDLSGCNVVINRNYRAGMASSLRVGISAVSGKARGVLILHSDMPYITPETIRKVIAKAEAGELLVAPSFRGRRGFPVYVARECFPELLSTLKGEIGARAYIAAHPEALVLVPVGDPGAVTDIDRPQDLEEEMKNAGLRTA